MLNLAQGSDPQINRLPLVSPPPVLDGGSSLEKDLFLSRQISTFIKSGEDCDARNLAEYTGWSYKAIIDHFAKYGRETYFYKTLLSLRTPLPSWIKIKCFEYESTRILIPAAFSLEAKTILSGLFNSKTLDFHDGEKTTSLFPYSKDVEDILIKNGFIDIRSESFIDRYITIIHNQNK